MACVYIFVAIAIVVDEYFIAALDKLCSALNLDEDVAGATFMAGGSSSPELFTAIIGIFVAKGDVGVGTIVGSAVFNMVCVYRHMRIVCEQRELYAWTKASIISWFL